MGFKSRNIFGAQLNRNFKAGSNIADNVTKSLLLGGLVGLIIFTENPNNRDLNTDL